MKSIIFTIALIIVFTSTSFGQIDTLTTNEIGTISLLDSIRQLYIQNLDNDSLKEIILCTASHVYVYHAGIDQPLWVSPELVRPIDLQFADINGDSLIDISVRDSANISLYNPHDSTLIYSTTIPSLFRCYTIGDANDDGYGDLAIVRQEPFDGSRREDSVWTKIEYGPSFSDTSAFFITMANWSGSTWSYVQSADKINIVTIGNSGSPEQRIVLNSRISDNAWGEGGGFEKSTGRFWIINPLSFQNIGNYLLGKGDYYGMIESPAGSLLYSLTSYFESNFNYPALWYIQKHLMCRFGPGGMLDSTRISFDHYRCPENNSIIPSWTSTIGDLYNSSGPEICFFYMGSLKEYSIQNRTMLWEIPEPIDSMAVVGSYSSSIFPSAEVLIREISPTPQYLFLNGITHQVNAAMPIVITAFTNIMDLNNDGNDEILSLSGNTLHIYNLEWATVVEGNPILPIQYLAVSNYPNPFNSNTIIKYNLPLQCDVAVEIYDILGRSLETIRKTNQSAGPGEIFWDASGKPSGVYFYRLQAGNENKTGRMVLLK
jgi:hypothetical protein